MECQQKLNTTTGTINFKITVQIAHKSVQQTLHSLRMLLEDRLTTYTVTTWENECGRDREWQGMKMLDGLANGHGNWAWIGVSELELTQLTCCWTRTEPELDLEMN